MKSLKKIKNELLADISFPLRVIQHYIVFNHYIHDHTDISRIVGDYSQSIEYPPLLFLYYLEVQIRSYKKIYESELKTVGKYEFRYELILT